MMGATQVDRHGNQNISAIGDFARPKRQLLGSRGAPGNTVNNRTSYWVPKHSPRVFVEQVDIVSGVGPKRAKEAGPAAAATTTSTGSSPTSAVFDVERARRHAAAAQRPPRRDGRGGPRGDRLRPPRRRRRPDDPRAQRRRADADPRDARPEGAARPGGAGLDDRTEQLLRTSAHRAGRRPPPGRADRHGLGGRPPAGLRHRQRRRPGHPRQRHDDLRGARARDPRGQGAHRPAVRGQPPRRRRRRRRARSSC